jgi:uncharacterized protein (UPF0332 family)
LRLSDLLLEKAERYIRSAKLLAGDGDFDSAASRLYYAMFYIAERLLETKGLSFSSHRGVISAFGQHFAKTGLLDIRFHQALLTGFSQRQLGDYASNANLLPEDIAIMSAQAQEFLQAARQWLARQADPGSG